MTDWAYPDVRRLAGLTRYEPKSVAPEDVLALVEPSMSPESAKAVFHLARARPAALDPNADTILDCLQEGLDNRLTWYPLSRAAGALTGVAPEAVETLESLAKNPSNVVRDNAVRGFAVAAETAPEAVLPAVDTLFDRLTDTGTIPQAAATTLSTLASHEADILGRARTLLTDGTQAQRVGAARVFGQIVDQRGSVDDVPVASMLALLKDPDIDTSGALAALAPVATVAPDRVRPEVPWLLSNANYNGAVTLLRDLAEDAEVFEAMIDRVVEDEAHRQSLAKAVSDLAGDHPEVVATHQEAFLALLEDDHQLIQRYAAIAIGTAGRSHPERFEFAVDPLLDRINREWGTNNWGALWSTCQALRDLVPAYPRIPERVVELLEGSPGVRDRLLRRRSTTGRDAAAHAAEWITRDHPTLLYEAGAVPHLVNALDDNNKPTGKAAWALGRLCRAHPEPADRIAPALTDLVVDLGAGNVPDNAYRGLTETARIAPEEVNRSRETVLEEYEDHRTREVWDVVGVLASEYQPVFDRVAESIDEDARLKKPLVTLSVATERDPETARPYVDQFVELAATSDERSNATAVLAGIADGCASELVAHVDAVADLLYDPDRLTRESACHVAGGLLAAAPEAASPLVPRLRRLRDRDDKVGEEARAALEHACEDRPDG